MGRKKQTIICSGGIIGDSMGKTVAYMMGQTNYLPSQDHSFNFENHKNYYPNSKSGKHPTNFFEQNQTPQFEPFNIYSKQNGEKKFNDEENTKNRFNLEVSQRSSISLKGSISYLELEVFDSGVDLEDSIREEGSKESFEMFNEEIDIDFDDISDEIEMSNGLDFDVDSPLQIERDFEKENVLRDLPKNDSFLNLEPVTMPTPLSSLESIEKMGNNENLYEDDEESLKNLMETFNDLGISEDEEDFSENDKNEIKIDDNYIFDDEEQIKKNFEELLGKRHLPSNYNWSSFRLKAEKKIKAQLIYDEPNIYNQDDNFYNLLIDRYRTRLYPT